MEEQKKVRPKYSNDFIAVWEKTDKNGNTYLAVKLFGEYYNVFQIKQIKSA